MTAECSVTQCPRVQHSSGLCFMHYQRRSRTGSPLGMSGVVEARNETANSKGLGKIKCAYCNKPVRDHEMRPCPTSGTDLLLTGEGVSDDGLRRRRYRKKSGR